VTAYLTMQWLSSHFFINTSTGFINTTTGRYLGWGGMLVPFSEVASWGGREMGERG